jgi:hypothetical protein
MALHEIVDDFRFNPSANTAMALARELAKYPHVGCHVSEHTKQKAVICLNESSDTLHHHFASYLKS